MSDRSLKTVVTDTFTAPRYVHHLVKLLTGLVVLGIVYPLLRSGLPLWAVAGLLSLAWVLTTKVAMRLERGAPLYTVGKDLLCDLALHLMPVGLMLLLLGQLVPGLALLGVLAVVYVLTYPDAQP